MVAAWLENTCCWTWSSVSHLEVRAVVFMGMTDDRRQTPIGRQPNSGFTVHLDSNYRYLIQHRYKSTVTTHNSNDKRNAVEAMDSALYSRTAASSSRSFLFRPVAPFPFLPSLSEQKTELNVRSEQWLLLNEKRLTQ